MLKTNFKILLLILLKEKTQRIIDATLLAEKKIKLAKDKVTRDALEKAKQILLDKQKREHFAKEAKKVKDDIKKGVGALKKGLNNTRNFFRNTFDW